MYKCIFRDLDPEVFSSHVQICTYPELNMMQEGQAILKDQWSKWDIVTIAENEATDYQGIQIDIVSIDSESTIAYDIDAHMIIDHDIVECESESVQNANVEPDLPDINQLRVELNIIGRSDGPPVDFIMPTDYYPATPRYSPASLLIAEACHLTCHQTVTQIMDLCMTLLHHNKMDLLLQNN